MLWLNLILSSNFIFLCFKLIIHYQTREQREIKFKPKKNKIEPQYIYLIQKRSIWVLVNCDWSKSLQWIPAKCPNAQCLLPMTHFQSNLYGIRYIRLVLREYRTILLFFDVPSLRHSKYIFGFISQKTHLLQFCFTRKNI